MQKSISSGEMVSETTTTGGAAPTEANAAAAVLHSTDSQTRRQQEIPPTTLPLPQPLQRERVDGTVVGVTKVSNVPRIAHSSNPSTQVRSRETVKGAVACELGDPLLLIIS